jgi:hypothetical protein
MLVKVYKVSVSTDIYCSNPTTILNESDPELTDFLVSPTLGSGQVGDDTYQCIIIELSDNLTFSSSTNSTSGNCAAANDYTIDVCSAAYGASYVKPDGTTETCDDTEQIIKLHLSTTSTSSNANAFLAPTEVGDASTGFPLTSALEISGTSSAKFVVNGNGQVCDSADGSCNGSGSSCEMEPPSFSFSKI